jgi:hypothetical protein
MVHRMIIDPKEDTTVYMIDVGRPSFTEQDHRDFWSGFFRLVETTAIPVMVNSAYHGIKQRVDDGQSYLGGGFKFCFWFETKDDRRAFAKECATINVNIEDFRNIMLCQDLAKVMRLRFSPIYENYARNFGASVETEYRPNVHPFTNESLGEPIATGWLVANGEIGELHKLKAHLNECFFDLD